MSDELTDTVKLNIPDHAWAKSKILLHAVRCVIRDAGGTSRMTKSKNLVTLRVTGPAEMVLDIIGNVHKLNRRIAQIEDNAREKFKRDFIRTATSRREENLNAVLDNAYDIMRARKK